MVLIKIVSDSFDIARRIKEIDEGYYIVFNTNKQRFEVHNSAQGVNTLSAVLPYDRLDARTIIYLYRTRRENSRKLIAEIEAQNLKIQNSALNYDTDMAKYRLKDYIGYAENKLQDVDFSALN